MQQVKVRTFELGLAPRRTRMEVPGWSGRPEPRRDGSQEYVWHCMPFTESATYGIEIFYPHSGEVRVTGRDGTPVFEGDIAWDEAANCHRPPFRSFGGRFYSYQLLLDLKPEPGFAIRTEPHPRFYTDVTGTVPLAVPALIRDFWPMVNFCIFKTPAEGQTHVFRQGEPMMQMIVVPAEPDYELIDMGEEEAAERELQSRRIHTSRDTLGKDTHWVSTSNTAFDGTYRHILRAAKSQANEAG